MLLRDGGRVPARSLQLLVKKAAGGDPGQIAGWVIGELITSIPYW